MLVIKFDVYLCIIQGDITVSVAVFTVLHIVHTCELVQALPGDMVVLIDPLAVTFEVDLGGRRRPAAQLDRTVLHDEGIFGFQQELRQGLCWS